MAAALMSTACGADTSVPVGNTYADPIHRTCMFDLNSNTGVSVIERGVRRESRKATMMTHKAPKARGKFDKYCSRKEVARQISSIFAVEQ